MSHQLREADAAGHQHEERAERDRADEGRRGRLCRVGVAARIATGREAAGEGAPGSPGSRRGGAPPARAARRAAPMPCRSASSSSIALVATSSGSSSRPSASRCARKTSESASSPRAVSAPAQAHQAPSRRRTAVGSSSPSLAATRRTLASESAATSGHDTIRAVPRLRDVPLFPLGIVLLPGEVLPLHIFEPRYRELVARCLAGPEPFCVVHADDDGMRDVGCLAIGLEIVERFDDGRLSIVVTGGEPLQIERVDEDTHPYLSADGVTIEDDGERATSEAVEKALDAYRELVDVAEGGEGPPEPEIGARLSYEIAGRIDFGPEVKQRLLEARSEPHRLDEVVGLVERATKAVRTASAVSARAHTNGRVSPPDEVGPGDAGA